MLLRINKNKTGDWGFANSFLAQSVYNDTSVEKEQSLRDDQQLISEGSFRGDYVIDSFLVQTQTRCLPICSY